MRNRATLTFYISLPEPWGAEQLELMTSKLIGIVGSAGPRVLNATWSAPTLGRKQSNPGPVLAFERTECERVK
jgi:hypothetical protein